MGKSKKKKKIPSPAKPGGKKSKATGKARNSFVPPATTFLGAGSVDDYIVGTLNPMSRVVGRIPDASSYPTQVVAQRWLQEPTLVFPTVGAPLGGTAIAFLGSPGRSAVVPSIDGTSGVLDWSSVGASYYNHGNYGTDHRSRPISYAVRIRPRRLAEGSRTRVTLVCLPIGPTALGSLAAIPTGWPGSVFHALNSGNLNNGGFEVHLHHDEVLELMCTPVDNTAREYRDAFTLTDERGTAALAGWIVIAYGFESGDRLSWEFNYKDEFHHNNPSPSWDEGAIEVSPSKPSVVDEVVNGLSWVAKTGWDAVKGHLADNSPAIGRFIAGQAGFTAGSLIRASFASLGASGGRPYADPIRRIENKSTKSGSVSAPFHLNPLRGWGRPLLVEQRLWLAKDLEVYRLGLLMPATGIDLEDLRAFIEICVRDASVDPEEKSEDYQFPESRSDQLPRELTSSGLLSLIAGRARPA